MFFLSFRNSIITVLANIPWWHWVILGFLSILAPIIIRRRSSVYSAIVLGGTVFISLLLIEVAIVIRWPDRLNLISGFDFGSEYNRLFHGNKWAWVHFLSNMIVFVPFGFFLSEYLASTKRSSVGCRIRYVTMAGFGLSLCIECLQLVFRLGLFEVTDLVMNTFGAFVGGVVSLVGRKVLGIDKRTESHD